MFMRLERVLLSAIEVLQGWCEILCLILQEEFVTWLNLCYWRSHA